MKRRFTILTAALALLTFLAVPMGMWGQTRTEEVAYTLTPASGSNNSYAGNCDIEINGITWNLTGNSTYQPWRIGGKSISNTDRPLYSKTAISDNISKIEVTHDGASSITVNSWTVIVASDANFTNVVSTLTPTFVANATTTINRPTGANWSNCYYKFVYNVTVSGNSNKYLEFTGANFYKEDVPSIVIPEEQLSLSYEANQNGSFSVSCTNGFVPNAINPTLYSDAACQNQFPTSGDDAWIVLTTTDQSTINYSVAANNSITERTVYLKVVAVDYYSYDAPVSITNVFAVTQAAQPQVATPTFSPAAGEVVSGTQVTISCATENATIYYTVNNGDITEYSEPIVITEATTIDAFASANGYANSETATANYTIAEIHTVAWALENTPSNGVYVQGIVSGFYSGNIMGDGSNFRYYISDNGGTYNGELLVYKGKDLGNVAFNSVDDLMIGDVVTIYGDLYDYQGTKEFNAGNYIVSKTRPVHNPYNLTIPEWVNFELFAFYGLDSEPAFDYSDEEADHWGTIQVNDGTQVELSISAMLNYEIQALVVDGVNVTDQLDESGLYVFMMPDHAVTVTATATRLPYYTVTFTTNGIEDVTLEVNQGDPIGSLPTANASYIPEGYTFVGWYNGDYEVSNTAPDFITGAFVPTSNVTLKAVFAIGNSSGSSDTYALVSDVNDLNDGDIIILVSTGSYKVSGVTHYFTVANGTVNSSNLMDPVDVTISDNKVTSTDVAPITLVEVTGGWKLQMGSQYLMNNAGKNEIVLDDEGAINTITISSNNATIGGITDGADTRNIYYNPNSGNGRFAYYKTKQKDISIYKQESSVTYSNYRTSLTESHTLTVLGYADYSAKDGYCLIASPVTVDPATVEGMVVANTDPNYQYFDLYSFANNQDEEWRNYKNTHFDLVPGTGYLYAKKATTEGETFSFELTGAPYSGDGEIPLTQGTGNWADWNLVGNPYGVDAEISMDYYEMNGDGSGLMPGVDEVVDAMQGVFVEYTENDQTVIFLPQRGANPGVGNRLVLNLVRNRGTVIDRAIVRFGEGRQMTKFTLFENSTKLYIPQDDEDYAIVRSEAQGELPVSFRASENGTYTIAVEAENVDMNYLHLIDNMTGMDIDLLQTPSYTFEANTNDYANRFKLVFAANGTDEADESSFAFFSNGNLIVNNEGNATLQVIDINGRILSSETISGSCSKAINATTGVYMLRLINGDNVKVQKVVVR